VKGSKVHRRPEVFFSLTRASVALAATCFAAQGCAGDSPQAKTAAGPEEIVAGRSEDDKSRCKYKGRADREVKETASLGSNFPNIRRVYALVGEGEEIKQVLLCREVDTNLDGVKDVVRTYNDKGEPITELADTDYNGAIDTWVTFSHGRVSKIRRDTNGDRKPDETELYVRGRLSRIQRDTNHDGKTDVWEIYNEQGRLERIGVDLDGDGHVDRWDRDEIFARQRAEKEREEEEREAQLKKPSSPAAATDAGAPDARSSTRRR
jgi:hypothetical protein